MFAPVLTGAVAHARQRVQPGPAGSDSSPAMAFFTRTGRGHRVLVFGALALVCWLGFVAAGIAAPGTGLAGGARTPNAGLAAPSADPPQARDGFEQNARAPRRVEASANPLARQRDRVASHPFRGRRAFLLDTTFQIHWHLGRPLPPVTQEAQSRDVQCRKVQRRCVTVPPPPAQPGDVPAARRGSH